MTRTTLGYTYREFMKELQDNFAEFAGDLIVSPGHILSRTYNYTNTWQSAN